MSPAWHIPEGIWSQCLLSKPFYSLTVRLSVNSIWKLMSLLGLSLLDNSGQPFAVNLFRYGLFHTAGLTTYCLSACVSLSLTLLFESQASAAVAASSDLYCTWGKTVLSSSLVAVPKWQEKVKVCSLYSMRALKALCEALSRAESVSCKKHLMSVCGSMLKHFQPSCFQALRNNWAQAGCVCWQQAPIYRAVSLPFLS